MRDHSFKDVAKTLVEDFESATISYSKPSWIGKSTHLWMCGTSKNGDQKEKEREKSELNDYILNPFQNTNLSP